MKKFKENQVEENPFTGLGDQPKDRARFVIFKGKDGKYYFRLQASNYEIVCQSEAYETMQGAKKGINAVKNASKTDDCFVVVNLFEEGDII